MPNSESSEDIEGVLAMTDSVILMLDSAEGIISQTKFALSKALAQGFQPLVIFDKIEREDQRSDEILSEIENFLLNSQASELQLAFQYLYASSRNAWAIEEFTQIHDEGKDFTPLFHKLIHYFAPSDGNKDTTFSMLVSALQYDKYAGRMLVGRIQSGMVKINEPISAYHLTGEHCENGRVVQLFQYNGNERVSIESAVAGDIVMIAGMAQTTVTDTLCTLGEKMVIPTKPLNPYTISIHIGVNTNMRASGNDEAYNLMPPKIMSFPEMITYLNSDECIEVTPISLRMRKIFLDSTERKSKMRNISRNSYQIVED